MFSPLARGCASWTGELRHTDSGETSLPSLGLRNDHHRHGMTVSRWSHSPLPRRTPNYHEKPNGELVLPKTFITKKGALLLFTVPDEIQFSDEQKLYLEEAEKLLKHRYAKYSAKFGNMARLAQSVFLFGDEDYEHEDTSITDPDNKAFFKFIRGLDSQEIDLRSQPGGDLDFYLRDLKSRASSSRSRRSALGSRTAWNASPSLATYSSMTEKMCAPSNIAPPSQVAMQQAESDNVHNNTPEGTQHNTGSLTQKHCLERAESLEGTKSPKVLSSNKITASLKSTNNLDYQMQTPVQESIKDDTTASMSSRRSSLSLPRSRPQSHKSFSRQSHEKEPTRPRSAFSRISQQGTSMSQNDDRKLGDESVLHENKSLDDLSRDELAPSDPDNAQVVSRGSDALSRISSGRDSLMNNIDDDTVSVASSLLREEDIIIDEESELDKGTMEVIVEVREKDRDEGSVVEMSQQLRLPEDDGSYVGKSRDDVDEQGSEKSGQHSNEDVGVSLLSAVSGGEGTFMLGTALPDTVSEDDILVEDSTPAMLSHRHSLTSVHSAVAAHLVNTGVENDGKEAVGSRRVSLSSPRDVMARHSTDEVSGRSSRHSSRPSSVRSLLSGGHRSRTPAPAPPSSPSDSRTTTPAVPADQTFTPLVEEDAGLQAAAEAERKDEEMLISSVKSADVPVVEEKRDTSAKEGKLRAESPGDVVVALEDRKQTDMKPLSDVKVSPDVQQSSEIKATEDNNQKSNIVKRLLPETKSELSSAKDTEKIVKEAVSRDSDISKVPTPAGDKINTKVTTTKTKPTEAKSERRKQIEKETSEKDKKYTTVLDISSYDKDDNAAAKAQKPVVLDTKADGVRQKVKVPEPPKTARSHTVKRPVVLRPKSPPTKSKQEVEVEKLEKEVSEILTADKDKTETEDCGEDGGLTLEELELEQKILQQKLETAQNKLEGKKADKKTLKGKERKPKKKKDKTDEASHDLTKQREALKEARRLEKQRKLEEAKKLEDQIRIQEEERRKKEKEAESQRMQMKEQMAELEAEEEATRQAEEEARENLAEARRIAREEREKRRKEDVERKKAEAQRRREMEKRMMEEARRKEQEMLEKIADAEMRKQLVEDEQRKREEEEEREEERREEEERLAKFQAEQDELRIAELERQAEEEAMQRLVLERQETEAKRLALQAEARRIEEEEERRRQELLLQQQKLEEERRRQEEEEQRKREQEKQRLAELQRLEEEAREKMRAELEKRRELALKRRDQNIERRGHLERVRHGQGVTRPWIFSYYVKWPRETYERLMGGDPKKKRGFRPAPKPKPKPA